MRASISVSGGAGGGAGGGPAGAVCRVVVLRAVPMHNASSNRTRAHLTTSAFVLRGGFYGAGSTGRREGKVCHGVLIALFRSHRSISYCCSTHPVVDFEPARNLRVRTASAMEDRKARLARLREEAAAAGEVDEGRQAEQQPAEEPTLKFRNYAAKDDAVQKMSQKVEPAKVPEFEEVKVDPEAVLGGEDGEELLINVAPKKANWDLRRDIAGQLAKLERRTQAAMIKLMQQEEARRLAEEGGVADA